MTRKRREATLSSVGELRFLSRILSRGVAAAGVDVGPGDDCAVLQLGGRAWLWTTDEQIEGTHFETAWLTPRQIGARAYLVNASDIAAMGGRPRFALVGLAAPVDYPAGALAQVQRGLVAAAARDGVAVVGGNLARAPVLQVTVSLLGEAPRRPLARSGARAGDALYVTGTLGDAALGLRLLRADASASGPAVRRFRRPQPRLAAAALLAERRIASAMIDVSDGLLRDLAHVCRASGVGAWIDPGRLPMSRAVRAADPRLALEGGEDYELLCAVPARKEKELVRVAAQMGCRMSRMGEVRSVQHGIIVHGMGRVSAGTEIGYSHFLDTRRRR